MDDRILDISDLYVTYKTDENTVYAVNGLDLYVKRGETLGLVGETGAGKTTTALSVMKLLPDRVGEITKGKIVLDGLDITKASEADMRLLRGAGVSMIFQDPMTSLNPILRVGDQIGEVLKLHTDLTKEQIEMLEILQKVDVGLLVAFPAYEDRKRHLEWYKTKLEEEK